MAFHNVPPNGFPDIPDMEELEAVVKDVNSLKTSVAGLTTDVGNLSDNKANQITIAPFFNADTAYDPGDLVYYNGLSYRCVNAHEGEWDADDFAATTVSNELAALKSGLTNVSIYTNCKGTSQASTLEHVRAVYNSTTKIVEISGYISDVSFVQGLTVIDNIVSATGRPSTDTAVSIFTTEAVNAYAYVTSSGNLAINSNTAFAGSLFLSGIYTVG